MSNTPKRQGAKLNSRAAINKIKVESLPSFTFSGGGQIVPYGLDNNYPRRVNEAIKKSPTSLGCVKRQSEFIFGNGLADGKGEIIVNRDGETLNDIVSQCIRFGYSTMYGYGLHFNFNGFGQITEMFFINPEYIRKQHNLRRVEVGLWMNNAGIVFQDQQITFDLYGKRDPAEAIKSEGFKYKGQIHYFSRDGEIYPTSPLDSALISASYEKEAQIYPYANIKNGFSGNTIIKYPTMAQGENAKEEANKVQADLESLHGAENAGSSLAISVPVGASGEPKAFQMVEHLSPTNVDGLFVNQNAKAENDILKVYTMPKVLLGVTDRGMFNEATFADAFNYKNLDTEIDRKAVERDFNKFLPNSVFGIDKINLVPFARLEKT